MVERSLEFTNDGFPTLFSKKFNARYHSIHGSWVEAQIILVENALRLKLNQNFPIRLFELGFGTGLNAYASLIFSHQYQQKVLYHAIEKYPISKDEANIFLNAIKEKIDLSITNAYQNILASTWGKDNLITPNFEIKLYHDDWLTWNTIEKYDIMCFDAFAPDVQPELWSEESFIKAYNLLNEGGIFVTYCSKGIVKRMLKSIGFTVFSPPGPPGKREITKAIKI